MKEKVDLFLNIYLTERSFGIYSTKYWHIEKPYKEFKYQKNFITVSNHIRGRSVSESMFIENSKPFDYVLDRHRGLMVNKGIRGPIGQVGPVGLKGPKGIRGSVGPKGIPC